MMPDTSTIFEKQDFAAFSTVTAGPFGASASSAATAGCKVRQSAAKAASERKDALVLRWGIGNPEFSKHHRYQTPQRGPSGRELGNRRAFVNAKNTCSSPK